MDFSSLKRSRIQNEDLTMPCVFQTREPREPPGGGSFGIGPDEIEGVR